MRPTTPGVPLHMRLVLVNGVVFAVGVLAMSLLPGAHRGSGSLVVLVVGLAGIVAVNTRHLRQSLGPLTAAIGSLGTRWESERRAQAARSIATTEQHHQRMAVQLHDIVGGSLSAALVTLKRAMKHAPPELASELRSAHRMASLSLVEVRRIGRRLRPEILEDQGLQNAVGSLATTVVGQDPSVRVRKRLEGPFPDLDEDAELVVYRVAEEALRNVARHSHASRVELSLVRDHDDVVLRVADDGIGQGGRRERSGILGMRERAALVGGRLVVAPRRAGGTEVLLRVPPKPSATA